MSKAPDFTAANGASPPRLFRFSRDWITRPVFGGILALMVIAAIIADRPYLELVIAAAVFAAAREWHRMVGKGKFGVELAATTVTLWLMLAAFMLSPHGHRPEIILLCGTILVMGVGLFRRNNPLWQAGGVLYLGLPCLALLSLRDAVPHGAWVIGGLFVVVWATDTSAFVAGNLIGGAKLAPELSPNKTWSGTLGGIAAAALMEAIYIAILGGNVLAAVLFGAVLAVAAHLGDLFESLVKRIFRTKDSGGLIPGHGGVLDRVDSTLFASVVLAIVVFGFHFDPLFGATP